MNNKKDYYKVLGIGKDFTEEELKLTYKKLAKKYHPDLNKTDPRATEKFIELKEAYNTLSDPVKRKIYDYAGYNPNNIDLGEIFGRYDSRNMNDLFRTIFSQNRRRPYYKPPPEGMYI